MCNVMERRCVRHDLETGEVTPVNDPALCRALTYEGHHNHRTPWAVELWQVWGWGRREKREVPIGYLVTSDVREGRLLSQPRVVAMIEGLSARSLWLANLSARCDGRRPMRYREMVSEYSEKLINSFIGMLLYPCRSDGQRMKMTGNQFPAAIFHRYKDGILFNRLTRAEVNHLLQQKSGTSEPLTAASRGSKSSNEKALTTAA